MDQNLVHLDQDGPNLVHMDQILVQIFTRVFWVIWTIKWTKLVQTDQNLVHVFGPFSCPLEQKNYEIWCTHTKKWTKFGPFGPNCGPTCSKSDQIWSIWTKFWSIFNKKIDKKITYLDQILDQIWSKIWSIWTKFWSRFSLGRNHIIMDVYEPHFVRTEIDRGPNRRPK